MKGQFFPYSDDNPTSDTSFMVYGLIAINVVVFFFSLFMNESFFMTWGFIPLIFSPITLLTSMFLHGGVEHILFNMWFLYLFGDNIEDKMGHGHFIVFYLVSGVVAALIHFITNPASAIPTIGASGAISGILGAYAALFPNVRVKAIGFYMPMNLSALWIIGFWFILQLLSGFISLISGVSGGIAFWAHIGGFVFGYLYVRALRKYIIR